ncbi:glycine betaine ABC transporter substrate-binding protein [Paenibacillus sp. NPDC058174]|uniref:ABC transporter substrate-binding protein n=1 Tax=Paenibacillus sp. NPDC058174 TaxID=3346366 RepID=UPI0036DDCB58
MKKIKFRRVLNKTALLSLLIALMTVTAACSSSGSGSGSSKIVIATKGFTESDILQQVLKLLVENDTDLKVETIKLDNNLLWEATKKGDVDLFVEYTGTALINILKQQPEYDPQVVYDKVKQQLQEKENLSLLEPLGFNNTYALAVRREVSEQYGITNITQLAEHAGELIFTAVPLVESETRPDGYVQAKKAYGIKFKQLKGISDRSLQVQTIKRKEADAILVYSTDGSIAANDLVVLDDDKRVFVPYYAAPLIRSEVLKAHPELKEVLNKLSGQISESTMQKLNDEVESGKKKPVDVARAWLEEKGLIKQK